MKRTDPQMRLRLPADVKRWLEHEAARNMRTQNAEIVMAIRAKMATAGASLATEPAEAGTSNRQETIDAANT